MSRIRVGPSAGVALALALVIAAAALGWLQERRVVEAQLAAAGDRVAAASTKLRLVARDRDRLRSAATQARKQAANGQVEVTQLRLQLERARAATRRAQAHAEAAARQAESAERAAERASPKAAAAAADRAARRSEAAASVDDGVVRERFTRPAAASGFLDEHGGGACDWVSARVMVCEYIA